MGLSFKPLGNILHAIESPFINAEHAVFGGGTPAPAPNNVQRPQVQPAPTQVPVVQGQPRPNVMALFQPPPAPPPQAQPKKKSTIAQPNTNSFLNNIKTQNLPGSFNATPQVAPSVQPNPIQAIRGLAQGTARGLYEIPTSIAQGISGKPINTQPTPVSKFLFGQQPFQTIQQMSAGAEKSHPGGFQAGPVHLTPKETGAAETGLQLAQDVPLVGAVATRAAKLLTPVNDATKVALLKTAAATSKPTKAVEAVPKEATPIEKAAAATTPALEGTIAASKAIIPKTSMPEVDKAIQDVSTQYTTPSEYSGSLQDIVGQAQGQSTIGTRAANGLRKALSDNLNKSENQAVSDILDNHPGAIAAATPKAREVAGALRPLQDQGFAIRQAIDPNVNRVRDYVARIPANTVGAAVSGGTKVLGKIRSLADITNLNSRFSQARNIGKFVGVDGKPVYGNPSTLGLVRHTDGTITNKAGDAFQQVAVSKRELEANGVGQYEHNISRISGLYHADTASLKVRAEALQHIQADPESLGLSKIQEPGMVPISKVKELADYYGKPEDVKALENNFGYKNPVGPVGKAYDAVSNVATQFIVLNPFFHGMNQLYQTAIAAGNMPGMGTGWVKVARGMANVDEQTVRDYLKAGGHIPDYGMSRENLLSNMTHGATKINNRAMSAIETKLRAGLYKASVDAGMKPKAAVANIDKFLGDAHNISVATRRFTLFFHYFETMAKALGSQVAHPIEQRGSIVNTAALAAITAAVTYGWQEVTGNKNAYVRVPGELGLVKEGVQSVQGIRQGNPAKVAQVVTNRINPVLKEGAQQVFNKDLRTGRPVTDTGRLAHAEQGLIAPAQTGSRVVAGKKSLTETVANQLGLYTPHAKGYQASPNIPDFNTKGAITGNGMAAQEAYFNGLATATKSLSGDKASTDAFNKYLDRTHDLITGQTIQNSPSESIQNSSALFANDKLRNTLQKFEQSQPSHDPMWDLPDDKLKLLMQYKEQFTGDAAKNFLFAQANDPTSPSGNWIKDVENQQADYYNNLQHPGGSKLPEPSPQTPAYPKFDDFTQNLLDTYDAASADEKTALLQNYGQQLSQAWGQKSDWTNAMRRAEGAPQLKGYPVADAQTQQIMNYYNSLPKGDGKLGGSPERAAWIKANPDLYSKMTNYLAQASLSSLVKNASLDQFQGATANQTLLKDIKNLGTYDIATTKNADGSSTYALNPQAAFAQSSSSSSSGFDAKLKDTLSKVIANEKKSSQNRAAERSVKALKYGLVRTNTRPKKSTVNIKGLPRLHVNKIKVAGVNRAYTPKVSLKPSSNKVKLKVK